MRCFAGLLSFALGCVAVPQTAPDDQALFQKNCALCHKPDAGRTMFVNSGYSQLGGMGGNVLLALTVDGK